MRLGNDRVRHLLGVFKGTAASHERMDSMIGGTSKYEASQGIMKWRRQGMGEFDMDSLL